MIIDGKNINSDLNCDVTIVGAGTVGLFIANQLKETYKKIIIIEKGDFYLKKKKNFFKSISQTHKGSSFSYTGIGGTSRIWGGQLVEFTKEDFNSSCYWGVDYNKIKNEYEEIYKIFKVNKINSNLCLKEKNYYSSKDLNVYFSNWLPNPDFSQVFKKDINDPYIRILTNVEAFKFEFINNLATKITVKNKLSKVFSINSRIYILATGAVAVNQLLLTNKEFYNVPWKKNTYLGSYFQDHIGFFAAEVGLIDEKKFRFFFENGFYKGAKYQPKLIGKYNLENFSLGMSGEFKFFSRSKKLIFIKKKVGDFLKNKNVNNLLDLIKLSPSNLIASMDSFFHLIKNKRIQAQFDKALKFYVQSEQIPLFESKIIVSNLKNKLPSSLLNVSVDWRISGNEFNYINNFLTNVNRYLLKHNIAYLKLDKYPKFKKRNKFLNIRDTNHPSGGTIISNNKFNGVVDCNLKIWGTNNIYIASSSVFPKNSFANNTLTILAFSLRLSKFLKKNRNII